MNTLRVARTIEWAASPDAGPTQRRAVRQKPANQSPAPSARPDAIEAKSQPVYSLNHATVVLLDVAIETLTSSQDDEAVHAVRKACKRARAALRLLREQLGTRVYRQENRRVRDAAKPLAAIRDGFMLRRALSALPTRSATLKNRLNSEYCRQRHALEQLGVLSIIERLTSTRQRLLGLPVVNMMTSSGLAGIRRTYKAGRKAFSKARSRDDYALHEWRKQAKYLLNQLTLLKKVFNANFKNLRRQVDRLAEILGDDHDLGVLLDKLHRCKGNGTLLRKHIEKRRSKLQAHAFRLGKNVYRRSTKHLERRIISRLWKS